MPERQHYSAPASARPFPVFMVGQNTRGQWLAVETHGLGGGLFSNKDAAIRYATFESDHRRDAVIVTGEPIELHI